MAFGTPNTVFMPKPSSLSVADGMVHLRIWLAPRKIQPTAFRLAADSRIGFEISFRSETEATAFDGFIWPPAI